MKAKRTLRDDQARRRARVKLEQLQADAAETQALRARCAELEAEAERHSAGPAQIGSVKEIRVMESESEAWPPHDSPEWEEPSRLVVAVGTDGGVAILDREGLHADREACEGDLTTWFEYLAPGVYLVTGFVLRGTRTETLDGVEYDTEADFEAHLLHPVEVPDSLDAGADILRARLERGGYSWTRARKQLLPDWWDEALLETQGGRFQTAARLANESGLPIGYLLGHTDELGPRSVAALASHLRASREEARGIARRLSQGQGLTLAECEAMDRWDEYGESGEVEE